MSETSAAGQSVEIGSDILVRGRIVQGPNVDGFYIVHVLDQQRKASLVNDGVPLFLRRDQFEVPGEVKSKPAGGFDL